jgi:cell division protein FtsL
MMKLSSFLSRYPGLVTVGKTMGILIAVILLSALFVYERFHIAQIAQSNETLQDQIKELNRTREFLDSKASKRASLDRIGLTAERDFGLRTPRPEQIAWFPDTFTVVTESAPLAQRMVNRLRRLHGDLRLPTLGASTAVAGDEGSR